MDGICEQLRRTRLQFVHCFLPQHNAGICDIKGASSQANTISSSNGTDGNSEILMNVPLVRSQVSNVYFGTFYRVQINLFRINAIFILVSNMNLID